jgi:hypothetical protein
MKFDFGCSLLRCARPSKEEAGTLHLLDTFGPAARIQIGVNLAVFRSGGVAHSFAYQSETSQSTVVKQIQ